MAYLIPPDYLPTIQDANLQQIISATPSILSNAELAGQAEAISFLRQKYLTDSEFTDTASWVLSSTYSAQDRVYLNATAYSASSTYAVGAYALQAGNVYRCITAITVAEAFNAAKWTLIGAKYDLYYAKYPHPLFDFNSGVYLKGDLVYWNGKKYTCIIPTTFPTHEGQIQARLIQNVPVGNVFPDDTVNGLQNWGVGVAYSVPANTAIDDTEYWTAGDNRDEQMVQKVIDIVLYHLHSRISPRNIPALREYRYMGNEKDRVVKDDGSIAYPVYSALGWLQACARGEVTPNLPLIQPKQGMRIRYGGNVRNINSW